MLGLKVKTIDYYFYFLKYFYSIYLQMNVYISNNDKDK